MIASALELVPVTSWTSHDDLAEVTEAVARISASIPDELWRQLGD